MNNMTVNELINIIEYQEHKDYLLSTLDFFGEKNSHLKNKHNDFKKQFYFVGRYENDNVLTGEEKVFGDYLLFGIGTHYEEAYIEVFDDLKQLEEVIISGAGYMNPFTGDMVAVIFGGKQKFEIVGVNESSQEEVFDKIKDPKRLDFDERCKQLKVRWVLG